MARSVLLDMVGSGVNEVRLAEFVMVVTLSVGSKVAVTVKTAVALAVRLPPAPWLQAKLVEFGLTEQVKPSPAGGETETPVSCALLSVATGRLSVIDTSV